MLQGDDIVSFYRVISFYPVHTYEFLPGVELLVFIGVKLLVFSVTSKYQQLN